MKMFENPKPDVGAVLTFLLSGVTWTVQVETLAKIVTALATLGVGIFAAIHYWRQAQYYREKTHQLQQHPSRPDEE